MKPMKPVKAIALAACVVSLSNFFTLLAGAQEDKPAEDPKQVLFTNVRIFNGVDEKLIEGDVLVENNLIKEIGKGLKTSSSRSTTIEGEGRVLMPGLIEMHVHLSTFLPLASVRDGMHPYAHGALATLRANEMLMNGYTTVRDAGGAAAYLKKIIDAGVAPGPRIYPSENWITTTSGHGDFRELNDRHPARNGVSHFYDEYVSTVADGRDETTRAVRKSFLRGATQIKLFTSGGVTSNFDPLHSGPTADEIKAAVEVATTWDTYVMTHSFSEKAIRLAIDNGVRCIEHAPFLTDEIAKVMIEKDIYLATAVSPVLEIPVEVAEKTYPPASFKKWKEVRDAALNMLEVLKRNPEIKVMLGSDLLGEWDKMKEVDDKMNLEFKYFGKYLGNLKVLQMATSTAGEAHKMTGKMNPYPDGDLGLIKEGAYADLLLVDGNPLEDIEVMIDPDQNFKVIMKDGVIYKNSLLYKMFTPEQWKTIRKSVPHMYGDYNSFPDE